MCTQSQNSTSELIEVAEPVMITLSASEYQELVRNKELILKKLIECQDDLKNSITEVQLLRVTVDGFQTKLLEASIKHQKSLNFERQVKDTQSKHIQKFLDDFEAKWDNREEECEMSPELADDYITAATYQADYFGRTNNRVDDVKHWRDNYIPGFPKKERKVVNG